MWRFGLVFAVIAGALGAAETFTGRWAFESTDTSRRVFWLEVAAEPPVKGQFFGVTGGRLAALRDATIEGDRLRFRVERPSTGGVPMEGSIDLRLRGDALEGTVTTRGRAVPVRGWRSATIADRDDGSWRMRDPLPLLTANLDQWAEHPLRDKEWRLVQGVLSNLTEKAALLVSREAFWNFRLWLEYRLPKGGNAGIGLRHHYELQLADDFGLPPDIHGNASLYSQIAPSKNASRPAGEWQTLQLTLIGRDLTVVLNGVTVIEKQQVRGLTGLALNADETKPGPISLQGDHGRVEYRNVKVARLTR